MMTFFSLSGRSSAGILCTQSPPFCSCCGGGAACARCRYSCSCGATEAGDARVKEEVRVEGTRDEEDEGSRSIRLPSSFRCKDPDPSLPFPPPSLLVGARPSPPPPPPLSPRPVVWARNEPRSFAPSRSLPPGYSRLPPVDSGRLGTAAPSVGPRGEPRPPRPGRPFCLYPAGRRLSAPPGRGACPRGPGGASC